MRQLIGFTCFHLQFKGFCCTNKIICLFLSYCPRRSVLWVNADITHVQTSWMWREAFKIGVICLISSYLSSPHLRSSLLLPCLCGLCHIAGEMRVTNPIRFIAGSNQIRLILCKAGAKCTSCQHGASESRQNNDSTSWQLAAECVVVHCNMFADAEAICALVLGTV